MTIRTRSQENAIQIYKQVNSVKKEFQKEYEIWCKKLPILILRNGLSQATGFLWAKAKQNESDPPGLLLKHLAEHLKIPSAETLHRHVIKADLPEYQRLTRLTLEASLWYKRYTESLFEDE